MLPGARGESRATAAPHGVWSVISPLHALLQALPISHTESPTPDLVSPLNPHICGHCWTPKPCPHSAGALHLGNSPEPQKASSILPFHRDLFSSPSSVGFPSIVPVSLPRGYPMLWAMACTTIRFRFPVIGLFRGRSTFTTPAVTQAKATRDVQNGWLDSGKSKCANKGIWSSLGQN